MPQTLLSPLTGALTSFEAQALQLDDPRPHPAEAALDHLGHAVMTELLDVIADTALEDFQTAHRRGADRRLPFGEPADRA